jgi:hypothetical protein
VFARGIRFAAGLVVLFVLGGCGAGGPSPDYEPDPDVDETAEALRVKLNAQMADGCHRNPGEQRPQGCEKYITQMGNTVGTVESLVAEGRSDLAEPAERMADGIEEYRKARCNSAAPASTETCTAALTVVADPGRAGPPPRQRKASPQPRHHTHTR